MHIPAQNTCFQMHPFRAFTCTHRKLHFSLQLFIGDSKAVTRARFNYIYNREVRRLATTAIANAPNTSCRANRPNTILNLKDQGISANRGGQIIATGHMALQVSNPSKLHTSLYTSCGDNLESGSACTCKTPHGPVGRNKATIQGSAPAGYRWHGIANPHKPRNHAPSEQRGCGGK